MPATRWRTYLSVLIALLLLSCNTATGPSGAGKPVVVITSPPSGSSYTVGEPIAVQSASADASGIAHIELRVDDVVVRTDQPPTTNPTQFTTIQNWIAATAGQHTLVVRAYNASGSNGENGIVVTVAEQAAAQPNSTLTATVSPTETATPTIAGPTPLVSSTPAPTVCMPNAKFVSDVTIPDGTLLQPAEPFVKVWRVRNTGNCAWDNSFRLNFVGGAQMGAPESNPVPAIAPQGEGDITLNMQAPVETGNFTGNWRLRAGTVYFGDGLSVVINVPAATSTPSPTVPIVEVKPPPGDFNIIQTDLDNNGLDNGEPVTDNLVFEVQADPIGKNQPKITSVDLFIIDSDGNTVYKHTENNKRWCAFGGGDNGDDCTVFHFPANNPKWPGTNNKIHSGNYELRAIAHASNGSSRGMDNNDLEITIELP